MNLKNYALNFFLVVALSLVITGCNATEDIADDSSKEAEVERGLMALDNENYESAEEIFEKLKNKYPSDNTLKTYYSNALAGSAGLDTFRLMETIDELDENNSNDTIEIVGRTLTGSNQNVDPELTTEEIAEKREKFEKAISSILEIADTDYNGLLTEAKTTASRNIQAVSLSGVDLSKFTNDELVQLGLISFNHAVLVISDILITKDLDPQMITLKKQSDNQTGFYDLYINYEGDFTVDIENLSKLSIDMELISSAVTAIEGFLNLQSGETNDISEEFDKFKNDLAGDDNEITENDLENYLSNLIVE